jgi:hypothetical protein
MDIARLALESSIWSRPPCPEFVAEYGGKDGGAEKWIADRFRKDLKRRTGQN